METLGEVNADLVKTSGSARAYLGDWEGALCRRWARAMKRIHSNGKKEAAWKEAGSVQGNSGSPKKRQARKILVLNNRSRKAWPSRLAHTPFPTNLPTVSSKSLHLHHNSIWVSHHHFFLPEIQIIFF